MLKSERSMIGSVCWSFVKLTLYLVFECRIKYEFTDTLGVIFKTQGEMHLKDAKSFNLYYEFDINIKSPLLLYEM